MGKLKRNCHPRYIKGDIVTIGNIENCLWGYSKEMLRLCGQEVTIEGSMWSNGNDCYAYKIKEDKQVWWWDESCFEEPRHEEFEVADIDSLINFLMV